MVRPALYTNRNYRPVDNTLRKGRQDIQLDRNPPVHNRAHTNSRAVVRMIVHGQHYSRKS